VSVEGRKIAIVTPLAHIIRENWLRDRFLVVLLRFKTAVDKGENFVESRVDSKALRQTEGKKLRHLK
jgi:hypothetical protein